MATTEETQPLLPLVSPSRAPLSSGRLHSHRRMSFETGFPLVVAEEVSSSDDDSTAASSSIPPPPPAPRAWSCVTQSRVCAVPFTLLMSAIGAGTLAVPYTFVLLPPAEATLVLCCVGAAMAFTAATLVDVHIAVTRDSVCNLHENRETYQHLAFRAGGTPLARLAGGLTAFAVFGACVGCVRVVKDMAPALLLGLDTSFALLPSDEQQRAVTLTVWAVVLLVVLPLGCFAKISALRFSSYLGVAFSVYLVAAVAFRAVIGGGDVALDTPAAPQAEPQVDVPLFWRLSEVVGIYNFTFMLHLNVIPLLAQLVSTEMTHNSQQDDRGLAESGGEDASVVARVLVSAGRSMRTQLGVAVGVCVLLYATFGLCAAHMYGAHTQGNILLNLAHDPIMAVPRLAVLLTILLSFPLLFHPLRALVLEIYASICSDDASENAPSRLVQVVVTLSLLVAQVLCALRVPGLQVVFSFVGASILLVLCYLLPLVFYVRLAPWRSSRRGKARLALLAAVAVVATVFCVAATLQLVFSG